MTLWNLIGACLPYILGLGIQNLRQIHRLGEHDVVLVELNTSCTACFVRFAVHLDAYALAIKHHICGVVAHPNLAGNLLALDIPRLVHRQVRAVVGSCGGLLVILGGVLVVEMGDAVVGCHTTIHLTRRRVVASLLDHAEELVQVHFLVRSVV